MPKFRDGQVPKLRLHRSSGLAVVTLSRRDVYCGPWGDDPENPSEEARRRYNRALGEWLANGRRPLPRQGQVFTVSDLCRLYSEHAAKHYRKTGRLTTEYRRVVWLTVQLVSLFGDIAAAEFGPVKLRVFRESLIRRGLSRHLINLDVGRVRRMWRWAVEQELAPPAVWEALRAVSGLQRGRTEAPDYPAVRPVPRADFEAVLPLLSPAMAAMLRLMDLTGARPNEIVGMRPCDIDRSAEPWRYTVQPAFNKMSHQGRPRIIMIGPKAREILSPWLEQAGAPDAPVFRSPIRRSYYQRQSIYVAVRNAARKVGVPVWGPAQLRHSAATRIRAAYTLDAARTILGHSDVETTSIYAEKDMDQAAKIAESIG